jgi:hypothetical protein
MPAVNDNGNFLKVKHAIANSSTSLDSTQLNNDVVIVFVEATVGIILDFSQLIFLLFLLLLLYPTKINEALWNLP